MSQHTPGPWEECDGLIVSKAGFVSDPYLYGGPEDKNECAANGRLIAAAPDLLQILQDIVENVGYGGGGAKLCEQYLATAKRAIAKATA